MRKLLLNIHLWVGHAVALPMLVVALTGALLVYGEENDQKMRPDLFYVQPGPARLSAQQLYERIQAAYPDETFVGCAPPASADLSFMCNAQSRKYMYADPYTGRVLGYQHLEHGLRRKLFLIHSNLMAGKVGHTIVAVTTVVSLVLVVTGVVLWWKFKIFGVKWRSGAWRLNFDLHSVFGLYSAVFFFILSLTGVVIAYDWYFYPLVLKASGAPPPPGPVASRVSAGRTPTIDEVIAVAEKTQPGARITLVGLPLKPTDAFNVYTRYPEDPAAFGRSRVRLDRYTLDVLATKTTREGNWGTWIVDNTEAIHFGDIGGQPTRLLAFIVSLSVVGQAITGFFIWWKNKALSR
jgi:uncharacterized iron-regulated membrane protein